MAQTIKLRRSATQGGTPTVSQLSLGEVAINTYDGKLYIKKDNGTESIVEIGGGASSGSLPLSGGTLTGPLVGTDITAGGYLQATSYLYTRDNLRVLNNEGTGWNTWGTRSNGNYNLNVGTITASGEITANGGIALGDNDKATFGAGDDLQIYHDGGNSIITNSTGNLIIRDSVGGNILIQGLQNQPSVDAIANGAVNLYYSGNARLATTSTGIDVTGTVTADGLTLLDNEWIYAGNGSIMKIGNDGTTSILRSQGEPLSINANGITFTGYSPYTKHMDIASNGDISFYEDTGTTAKFIWDASAESLSVGTFFSVSSVGSVNLTNVLAGSGSAASPAYSFGSDQNTGLYRPTTDTLAVTTAGSEKMRIDSSGNVGIGTILPSEALEVAGNILLNASNAEINMKAGAAGTSGAVNWTFNTTGTNYASIKLPYDTRASTGLHIDSGYPITLDATTSIRFDISGAEKMRLFSNGNLSIGTTSSLGKLTVSNSGAEGIEFFPANFTNGNTIQHYNRSGAAYLTSKTIALDHRFDISGTEAMRIDSSGNVGIGVTAPAAKLQVEALGIDTTVTSTTATTQVAIDSMVAATFRSARYTIQITNSTDGTYHLTEMLLIHNGTTPSINEFGTIYTGSAAEAVFTADINSGNVRILATPASTDAMAFKVVRHSITV